MRKLHCLLVLLVAVVFVLTFAVPAEDIPDSAYDESESMPYESALPLSLVLPEMACALQVMPFGRSDSRPLLRESRPAECPASGSLIILIHSLRC